MTTLFLILKNYHGGHTLFKNFDYFVKDGAVGDSSVTFGEFEELGIYGVVSSETPQSLSGLLTPE